jgi:hypothetical protein
MESLLPTLVVIVVALVGARVSFSTSAAPLGPRLALRTGTPFLALGFALGPPGLGLLTPEAVEALFPLLALGIGWVGFHFGLQLDYGTLERFPARHYAFALGQAALSLLIFGAVGVLLTRLFGLDGPLPLLLVLVAACTGAITTPAGIAMVSSTFQVKGQVRDLLLFVGSIDAIVAIVAVQVTYALFRPDTVAEGIGPASQMVFAGMAVGVGVVCGIVFIWLTRSRPAGEELVLFLLGGCAFAAGVALQWDLSPLFVSMTMGAVVANLSKSRARIQLVLTRWEKPVYLTFLLLAGALLQIPTWLVVPLALAYTALRFAAKVASGALLVRPLGISPQVPRRVGLGLIPQGGISIAMAVSGMLVYSDLQIGDIDAEAVLFAVIVIGVALSELMGPLFTLRLLRHAGEIAPEVLAEPHAQPAASSLDR